jgi:hypothetical protein
VKPVTDVPKPMRQDTMNRKLAKERLFLRLNRLARFCKAQDTPWPGTIWPDQVFLLSLEDEVVFLITTERKKRPSPAWKAFQLLNTRMPSLQLVLRINNLVKRARDRLEEAAQRPLSKLEQQAECGDDNAQKLLRDIAAIRDCQGVAKEIDWTEHERALAQFSRTRSVEPAYGRSAPLEIRCYARALELIVDDSRRKPVKSRPLTEWTARIGHPGAKSLLAFDDPMGFIGEGAWRWEGAQRKRQKTRDRVRRYREWVNGAWVYAGDWLRFSTEEKNRLKWGFPDTPKCEVCGESDEPYWWFHRLRHIVRCSTCQEAEWWADGYEISGGLPTSWLGHDATRDERIVERTFKLGSKARQWLQSPKGQAWLRNQQAEG